MSEVVDKPSGSHQRRLYGISLPGREPEPPPEELERRRKLMYDFQRKWPIRSVGVGLEHAYHRLAKGESITVLCLIWDPDVFFLLWNAVDRPEHRSVEVDVDLYMVKFSNGATMWVRCITTQTIWASSNVVWHVNG